MNALYHTPRPSAPPRVPDRWSFSSLREWRTCPRRWWLERATYQELSGRYPRVPNPAAVAGQLVHDALEAFAHHLAAAAHTDTTRDDARRSFPVRQFMKERLRAVMTRLGTNPRANKLDLLAMIDLDKCVDQFRGVAPDISAASTRDGAFCTAESQERDVPLSDSAELPLAIDDPAFGGKLDFVRDGVIYDFKTGSPDEGHAEQLRIYAMLFWVSFGYPPEGLVVSYASTRDRVHLPVPTTTDLAALRSDLRDEIDAANDSIRTGRVEAKPNEEVCRWCPVRQLCDSYWVSPATAGLRWPECVRSDDAIGSNHHGDIELSGFSSTTGDYGYVGVAEDTDHNTLTVKLPSAWCPGPNVRPGTIRILRARFGFDAPKPVVATARHSEVFWLGQSGM